MLGITILSYDDNHILFSTLKALFENTNFSKISPVYFFILNQKCSKSYNKTTEHLFKTLSSPYEHIKVEFIFFDENLGLSKANNILYEKSKDCEFVLHLENDWILLPTNKDWLYVCLSMFKYNKSYSTISLRKYGSEREKYQYGWTRTIPYICHKYKDNFNYIEKISKEPYVTYDHNGTSFYFYKIDHFLFTFNPCIRRNKDYENCGVYPIPSFEDADLSEQLFDSHKPHNAPQWGWCETFSMEKTRDLGSCILGEGVFLHYDDNIEYLKENELGPFTNNLTNCYNINCQVPILIIHTDKVVVKGVNHDFLAFLHFYVYGDIEKRIQELRKIFSSISPKYLVSVGKNVNYLNQYLQYIPFEYRKKWIHIDTFNHLNKEHVEYALFNAFYKHPQQINHPLISIITPAYESKHRILRPLQSLIEQTYTNWEWIIIDDSKSNDTWKTLTEMAEQDYRIQIYKRQKNKSNY